MKWYTEKELYDLLSDHFEMDFKKFLEGKYKPHENDFYFLEFEEDGKHEDRNRKRKKRKRRK